MSQDIERSIWSRPLNVQPIWIAHRRRLDLDLLCLQLKITERYEIRYATSDIDAFDERLKRTVPEVAMLDACFPSDQILRICDRFRDIGRSVKLIFLDESYRVHRARLAASVPAAYLTKDLAAADFLKEMGRFIGGVQCGTCKAGDLRKRGRRLRMDSPILSKLTEREVEVMTLLGEGYSVNQVAELMKLAFSTVDNHKSRLMKKLEVSKSTQLVRLAVRSGLIDI